MRPRHAAVLLLASLCAAPAFAGGTPGETPIEVRVQRVKPDRPKLPILRFLAANRDYLRAELDRLRVSHVRVRGEAAAIDPRFLRYGEMVAAAHAAGDSAAAADSARAGRELFASVTELGGLEDELDLLDRALARQRERLGVLQADYAGEQRTSLANGARQRLIIIDKQLRDGHIEGLLPAIEIAQLKVRGRLLLSANAAHIRL